MTELIVTDGIPADWDLLAGDGPAAGRAHWVRFGQSWYPGEYRTFALRDRDGSCLVGMGGTVLPSPAAVPRSQLGRVVREELAARRRFAAVARPPPAHHPMFSRTCAGNRLTRTGFPLVSRAEPSRPGLVTASRCPVATRRR